MYLLIKSEKIFKRDVLILWLYFCINNEFVVCFYWYNYGLYIVLVIWYNLLIFKKDEYFVFLLFNILIVFFENNFIMNVYLNIYDIYLYMF